MTIDHRPPPPGIRRIFWRYRMRFEATFGLSMLETWEKALVWTTLLFITSLFWLSVFTYLPTHLTFLRRRFSYYIFGDENVDLFVVLLSYIKGWIAKVLGDSRDIIRASGVSGDNGVKLDL